MLTGCALLFMLTLGGVSCDEEEGYRTGGPTEPPAQELVFGLEISSLSAALGDSVTVALSVPPERERALGAVLGRLYLDPEKMDLIGEVPDSGTIVSVNESVLEEGYLRFLAVNPRGLSRRMVVLAFEVTGAGYEAGLSFTAEQVVDSAGKESRVTVAPGVTLATDLPPASAARAEVGEGIEPSGPRPLGPIYPRLLGDALVDQDIDRFDSRRVSDIVSGKSPMPPAGSDDFYAADVTRDSVIDAVDAVLLSEYVEDAPVPHPIGEWLRLLLPSPEPVVSDSQSTFLNEIELRFRDGVPNERVEFLVDSIAVSLGATVEIAELSVFTLYAIRWPPEAGINMDTVIATIKLIPEVRMAQPGGFAVPYHKAPTDNGWSGWPAGSHADEIFWYWGADRDTMGGSWGWKVSDLPLAWACQRTSDIPIAVIDGGFTPTGNLHQDLSRASVYRTAVVNGRLRIVVGMDSSGTGHGMKVAGILGAAGDNGAGLTGVTWGGDLRLYQARTVWNDLEPTYPWRDLLMLVDSAVGDGARVINLSFGFEDVGPDELSMADSLLTDILASYAFAGVEPLVVVSAGNVRIDARYVSGLSHLADPAIYSGHDRVLVVGAANRRRTLWQHDVLRGSSFGPLVQIYAPGQDIETLGVGSGTELESGTSEAAPFVAGAASLLWSFDPTLTAAEVKSYLIRGAQADSAKRALQGHLDTGLLILNVYESLKLVARERPNTPNVALAFLLGGGCIVTIR